MIVSWNGQLIGESEVMISAFDGGLLRGKGVFETMLAVGGRVEFLARHLARLRNSAALLAMTVPETKTFTEAIAEVIRANSLTSGKARVRLTLSENLLVTAVPLPLFPERCEVVTVGSPINERSPLVGAKVCSYAENMTVLKMAGTTEAIRPNTLGDLCEGCLSNVFFVIDGKAHTPSLATGCLPGVIRAVILERNPDFLEGRWPLAILEKAEEIWLTGSTRRMTWVDTCDGREFGEKSALFKKTLANLKQAEALDLLPSPAPARSRYGVYRCQSF